MLAERLANHPPSFGNDVPGKILEEVIESLIIQRGRNPPHIPLCHLMENEVICSVGPEI